MSARDMWKMVHLLYRFGPVLTKAQLGKAGLTCDPDTMQLLEDDKLVVRSHHPGLDAEFELTAIGRDLLTRFLVASGNQRPVDMLVDYPRAFVVMPFSETWSNDVYTRMIEPAVRDAGLECVRGDAIVRVGDLNSNVWSQILTAGVVIAEVTAPNVNVYYELGLAHAIGRDVLLLKQTGVVLPADFSGAHYREYDPTDLTAGRKLVQTEVERWASQPYVRAAGVGALGPA